MALSADQITDFRRDLGIGVDGTVFTDDELNRLYDRAGSGYSKAVYLAFRQLLADAAKLNDYQLGSSSETKSQVFKHVKGLMEIWGAQAGVSMRGTLTPGVIDLDFIQKSGDA